ncbi:hypothetical protein ABHV46_05790 [Asaia sp. BMEF1]|uniref:hypothetical protein n=1 Tax=Asaia sp. BMEF1 TaxID=3155932 RepID=UPI003F669468
MPPAKLPRETQAEIVQCTLTGNFEKAKYVTRTALRRLDEAQAARLAKKMENEKAEAPIPFPMKASAGLVPGGSQRSQKLQCKEEHRKFYMPRAKDE